MALALQEEAAAMGRRVLGEAHPATQAAEGVLADTRERVSTAPPGACAFGTLVGLGGRPELNGEAGFVVGFDKGRYRVRLMSNCNGSAPSGKPLGIKPANLALTPGTAVIVEGLISQPEWNGTRLLVKSIDAEQGRYRLLVKGRARPLGVKLECCRLESLVEQDLQLQEAARVAVRRAEVQESVRAALAARAGPEPEHSPL